MKLSATERLALEMAVHEESERRAMEGELAVLEAAWRDAEIIAAEGRVIRGKFGSREHPLLRHQLALRSFVVRAVRALGIALEPVKVPGRPGAFA